MAEMLRIRLPARTPANAHLRRNSSSALSEFARHHLGNSIPFSEAIHSWSCRQHKMNCRFRFSCLFNGNNNKEEQARKALENALGGKRADYEKWDKEIKRREEANGGGNSGGGGGWFRWFGGSDGDHFWRESQQAILTILAIIAVYLVVAKGEVMLAIVFNPLLFTLRGARDRVSYVISRAVNKVSPKTSQPNSSHVSSAKESVMRKWGQ
ncbi:unnamed protein product [Cuscuta campestris]|uniref:Uncharacterized protein n=2 Tax=Cuscuta sect. Cleistogrammica TaxID=1824901 RepID=A0A484LZC4_9ASTE|nr:hypothetical protein DM860_012971 [Cuscuta australis]VFQ81745.1 unnamed protein product [Cuscuta campestris]